MRFAEGRPASLPFRTWIHLVAARYGQAPDAVRAWAADDLAAAIALFPWTGGRDARD